MAKKTRKVTQDELNEFIKKYDIDNIKTLNEDGNTEDISELEKNALDCITKTNMIKKDGDLFEVDEKMHAMYFAIHHFMETGSHIDAFNLYCVYSGAFLNDDGDQLQKMMNFVASYEDNAARLVMSHRDHYVHSAYVFILGLALYNTQEKYRKVFNDTYSNSVKTKEQGYTKFVELWGLTSLFHDIGYQYEIPFNQIKENNKFSFCTDLNILDSQDKNIEDHYVYFQYKNMDKYTNLKNFFRRYNSTLKICHTEDVLMKFMQELVDNTFIPEDIEDVIAYHIKRGLAGREYLVVTDIADKLRAKNEPGEIPPDKDKTEYEVFMDHAYYSGIRLFEQMINIYGLKFCSSKNVLNERMDAIAAITMHNKFFEKGLSNKEHLKMSEHPLAYLLILCDELQCWDRTSFGKSSVKQLFAIDCLFNFENEGKLEAEYCFDENNDAIVFKKDNKKNKIAGAKEGALKKYIQYKKDKKDTYIDNEVVNFKLDEVWKPKDCSTWKISSTDFIGGNMMRFIKSIDDIVECVGEKTIDGIALEVKLSFQKTNSKFCREYLTNIGMEDVYEIAQKTYEELYPKHSKQESFASPSRKIQEKINDIAIVQSLGKILHAADCFALKEQKMFSRVTKEKDFTVSEIEKMLEVMIEKNKIFLDENLIVYDEDINTKFNDDEKIKIHSKAQLDALLKVVVNYPGIEVYRFKDNRS